MRRILTAVLAACFATGVVATITPPALPAVRHLAVDHSPAPPLTTVEISQSSPVVSPLEPAAPPTQAVCTSCPPPNTGACGACPPQPATVHISIVRVPL
jgi:hypothetical protein